MSVNIYSSNGAPRAMNKRNWSVEIQYNDVNAQHANVTGSIKLRKLLPHNTVGGVLWASEM